MAKERDDEFGELVHEERVQTLLVWLWFVFAIVLAGGAGMMPVVALSVKKPEPGVNAVLFFVALFCIVSAGLCVWWAIREVSKYGGLVWRLYDKGIVWQRRGTTRRIAFHDVRQIATFQRTLYTSNGILINGTIEFRLGTAPDDPNPLLVIVRQRAVPKAAVTKLMTDVRDWLFRQVESQMREQIERDGRANWTGNLALTNEGIVETTADGERLVRWADVRRIIIDHERDELRVAEHNAKGSRLIVRLTGANTYPGMQIVVAHTGVPPLQPWEKAPNTSTPDE